MKFFMKNSQKAPVILSEYHFLFLERPYEEICEDVLQWGWSPWWPKGNLLQYSWISDGAAVGPQEGMRCQLTLEAGLKGMMTWKIVLAGEVDQLKPGRLMQIKWRSDWIEGVEKISVEERSNGTRVDHRVRYACQNLAKRLAWILFFRARYRKGIKKGLDAMGHQLNMPQQG